MAQCIILHICHSWFFLPPDSHQPDRSFDGRMWPKIKVSSSWRSEELRISEASLNKVLHKDLYLHAVDRSIKDSRSLSTPLLAVSKHENFKYIVTYVPLIPKPSGTVFGKKTFIFTLREDSTCFGYDRRRDVLEQSDLSRTYLNIR